MYGAILGDIIGSPFEFDRGTKTKDFELFTKGCQFTDDSVMTAAIAEALMAVGPDATKEEIEEAVIANMQDWESDILMPDMAEDFAIGSQTETRSHITVMEMVLQCEYLRLAGFILL